MTQRYPHMQDEFTIIPLKNGISNIDGFFMDGVNIGLKTNPANSSSTTKVDPDIAFIKSDTLCDVESIFTTNTFQASPLKHYGQYPKNFKTDFILMNSKNANAMTGDDGIKDIEAIFQNLKNKIDVTNPIMSSTGVIGQRLDVKQISSAFDKFHFNGKNSDATARAIMTTDTFKKELCFKVTLKNGDSFKIAGICKGAGMIEPSLATMLCFIITDANIPKSDMKELLQISCDQSFNTISVDGDTSTNDTLMLLSNGKNSTYDKEVFKEALNQMTKHFALEMLRDGEGSNKVVAFEITGALSQDDAKSAAKKLSNSLLVKTALFGEDPNWGRIASTIGASSAKCDESKLTIKYNDLLIYNKDFIMDQETEEKAYKIMQKSSFKISCDLGLGKYSYTAYGCDLSYEYVKINAEYRT